MTQILAKAHLARGCTHVGNKERGMFHQEGFHRSQEMAYRCPDLLLRIAIADAYTVAVENVYDPDLIERALRIDPSVGYTQNPNYPKLKASKYSDDGERAIGNTRTVIAPKCRRLFLSDRSQRGAMMIDPPVFTRLAFANAYTREFEYGGRRPGYARGYQDVLERTPHGYLLLERLIPTSCRNGGMMGAGVLGVLDAVDQVLEAAAIQASVTHNTICGIVSARVAALATHFALYYREPLMVLRDFIREHEAGILAGYPSQLDCGHADLVAHALYEPWSGAPVKYADGHTTALDTVQAVLTLVTTHASYMDALRACIRWQGDTDSVAAVMASIMAPRTRDEILPEFLTRDLEEGDERLGATRLRRYGALLMDYNR